MTDFSFYRLRIGSEGGKKPGKMGRKAETELVWVCIYIIYGMFEGETGASYVKVDLKSQTYFDTERWHWFTRDGAQRVVGRTRRTPRSKWVSYLLVCFICGSKHEENPFFLNPLSSTHHSQRLTQMTYMCKRKYTWKYFQYFVIFFWYSVKFISVVGTTFKTLATAEALCE